MQLNNKKGYYGNDVVGTDHDLLKTLDQELNSPTRTRTQFGTCSPIRRSLILRPTRVNLR